MISHKQQSSPRLSARRFFFFLNTLSYTSIYYSRIKFLGVSKRVYVRNTKTLLLICNARAVTRSVIYNDRLESARYTVYTRVVQGKVRLQHVLKKKIEKHVSLNAIDIRYVSKRVAISLFNRCRGQYVFQACGPATVYTFLIPFQRPKPFFDNFPDLLPSFASLTYFDSEV